MGSAYRGGYSAVLRLHMADQIKCILPRILRKRDAPAYLGMCAQTFDALVRPKLTEIPIGEIGIAFDRLELDAWADDYIRRNGRKPDKKGDTPWERKPRQDSAKGAKSGISKKQSEDTSFTKALELATSKKPNAT